jgi:hypothetical protein
MSLLISGATAHGVPVRFINEGYDWKPYISQWDSGYGQDIHYLDVRKPWNEQVVLHDTIPGNRNDPPGAVVYERRDFGHQFPSFDMVRGVEGGAPAWDPTDPRNSDMIQVLYSYDYGRTVPSGDHAESFVQRRSGVWGLFPGATLINRFNPANPEGFPLPTQSFMRPRDVVGIRMEVPGGFQYGWIEMELISIEEGARPIAWGYETEINTPALIVPEPTSCGFVLLCLAASPMARRSRLIRANADL